MKPSVGSSLDVDSILRVGMQSLLELFDDSCEGTLAVDDHGRVVWINDKYATFLGLKNPDEALGRAVEEIIPNSRMREVVHNGKPMSSKPEAPGIEVHRIAVGPCEHTKRIGGALLA
jgi:transcriptional regulator with PAS, ATPase and Fis domain